MLFNIKTIVYAVIFVVYSSLAGYVGYTIASNNHLHATNELVKQDNKKLEQTITTTKDNAIAANKTAGAVAAVEAEQKVVYRTITKELIKYVQAQPKDAAGEPVCKLDARGLQLDTAAATAKFNNINASGISNSEASKH